MADRKVTKTVEDDGVSFEFATGETVKVSPGDFSAEIQKQLMLHGLSQKLGDSYSGEDADKCHGIMAGVVKTLEDGNWSVRNGGGSSPRISQLADALSRATGQDVADCVAKLSAMDNDSKKAVRAHPQVVAALSAIKVEKAQADAAKAAEAVGDTPALEF